MFKKYVKYTQNVCTNKKCLHTQKMFKKVFAAPTYLGFWLGGGTLQQRRQKIFWGWNETT